jgi:coproporphyrinogen III oxidase
LLAEIRQYFTALQQTLAANIGNIDTAGMQCNEQQHAYGVSRAYVLEQGDVFERAALCFSDIEGTDLPKQALERHPDCKIEHFHAMGISMIFHPRNPFVPTMHANLRYFLGKDQQGKNVWWFGGGADLTPYYISKQNIQGWHSVWREVCKPFSMEMYQEFKKACDQYFYLPHRAEPRGVGGLFFDDFNRWPKDTCFSLVKAIGDGLQQAYRPLIIDYKDQAYTQEQRDFQCWRRSRYAEFNLLYDRGTAFGLKLGANINNILLSMPPVTGWSMENEQRFASQNQHLQDLCAYAKDFDFALEGGSTCS